MGKVVSLEKYKIAKEIRTLQEFLAARIDYCEKYGYVWIDHYTIRETHDKICDLKKKLEEVPNERSS